MDGFRAGIWDQCLQIIGNTLRPAEIHRTCQMISVRPIVLEEDTVHRICSILHTQLSQLDVKEELFINETHIHKYVFLCVPQVKNKNKLPSLVYPRLGRSWIWCLPHWSLEKEAWGYKALPWCSQLPTGRWVNCRSWIWGAPLGLCTWSKKRRF